MTPACLAALVVATLCPASSPASRPAPGPASTDAVPAHAIPWPDPVAAAAPGSAPAARAGRTDPWLAEDKLQHLGLSFATTTMGYAIARLALGAADARTAAGTAAGLAGVAKEVADHRRGGRFSARDMVWNAAGVALGLALVRSIP